MINIINNYNLFFFTIITIFYLNNTFSNNNNTFSNNNNEICNNKICNNENYNNDNNDNDNNYIDFSKCTKPLLKRDDYDFSKLDASSEKNNLLLIDSAHLSKIYGLPQGYSLLKDVGWQLPLFLFDNSIPYLIFDHIKPSSSDAKILAGVSDYHDEFHYKNLPFLVHQRGSMKHVFRLSKSSKDFYNRVEKHLEYPSWFVKPSFIDHSYFGLDFAKKAFLRLTSKRNI